TNVVQTNCTLLADDSFVGFLHNNRFNIGISCDGPSEIHDVMRPLVNGMPSLKLVEKGVANLSRYVRGNLSGNCVVSKLSLDKAKEIYHFFKEKGFSTLLISPYEGRDISLILETNEYFKLMKDFYSLWTSDDKPIPNVSPFVNIVKKLFAAPDNNCYFDGSCFNYFLAVDPDGNISPCCTIDKPILGNINHDSIESILSSSELSELKKIEGKVKSNCELTCDYFYVCNGGCRGSSYLTSGDISVKDIYCEGRYLLIDYIKKDLEERINFNRREEAKLI
ncbi:radical SAM protein, partial [Candidatus Woesearchaeota archaeon]|nr:radical SAM protein [Candidatus Woesearchaeota archaeon]